MRIRSAFTMIELIFVIIIMGILGKFGVEFMFQAYNSFIFTNINNTLQSNSASSLEFIASRLQYRIKNSVIARYGNNPHLNLSNFSSISSIDDTKTYSVLEWVSTDIDGYRGTTTPTWSGIIDLNNTAADKDTLISPQTDTGAISNLINILSHGDSTINNAAIYFVGSNSNLNGYGWNGAITDQSQVMHPIKAISGAANINRFSPRGGDFSGIDVYEYYKLTWTANAVVIENNTAKHRFELAFYFDYQPWDGQNYKSGKRVVIMENISTFQFTAIGSIMKIQICAKTLIPKEYSLCKEKTIF